MTRLNHHHHYYYYAADDDLLILQNRFLGVSAKLRKATITFVTSVRPSISTEKLGSLWTDFHEI